MKKYLIILSSALLFSGCVAFHGGYLQNSACLSSANFSYVQQDVRGQASATYILGIGGMMKQTLVDEAKKNMLRKFPLKNNQALANVSVNFKHSFVLGMLFQELNCVVTADIVEFNR